MNFKFKVAIHNDGKGKWHSYEARLVDSYGHYELIGYGEDEKEAREELDSLIDKYIKALLERE